jgi:menaquinone-dependent protoporphyrinogen oxidase
MHLLIAYATTHGQAAKVAGRVAEIAHRRRVCIDVVCVRDAEDISPAGYDAVVVVGSVHMSRHQHELVRWLSHHHTSLNLRPAALLSVSLSAAEDSDEARAATREVIDRLLDDTGLIPTTTLAVAGALRYRHYDLPTRIVLRLIAAHHGQPTDTSTEFEFTDWDGLAQFTEAFIDAAAAATPHDTPTEVPA